MIGYRSIIQLRDTEDAIRVAHEQFYAWFVDLKKRSGKGIILSEWGDSGKFQIGNDAWLTIAKEEQKEQTRLLFELSHVDKKGDTWTSRLITQSSSNGKGGGKCLLIEVEGTDSKGNFLLPAPPKLARFILEATEGYDGNVPIHESWKIVGEEDARNVFDYIIDETRNISVVVAGPVPGLAVDEWAEALAPLESKMYGLGTFFVLDDRAAAILNAKLGASHSVPHGSVRTFVPKVKIGDRADGRRHRVLTADTLSRNFKNKRLNSHLAEVVAQLPRQYLLDAPLNKRLFRTLRVMEGIVAGLDTVLLDDSLAKFKRTRLEKERVIGPSDTPLGDKKIDDQVTIDEPIGEIKVHAHESTVLKPIEIEFISHFRRIFGDSSITVETVNKLAQRLDSLSTQLATAKNDLRRAANDKNDLRDRVQVLKNKLDAEKLDHWETDYARKKAETALRSLEYWKSTRPDRYDYIAPSEDILSDDPGSVMALVERLGFSDDEKYSSILRYVQLSDPERAIKDAERVDAADGAGLYSGRFWEYVIVLRDYMIACNEHGFKGGVHDYLKSPGTVPGRKCPTERHKANESESVQNNSRARRERTFRVPETVDESGKVFMAAHFAPTHRDRTAPRMYYHIDRKHTNMAYIGYIGIHLTNSKTN